MILILVAMMVPLAVFSTRSSLAAQQRPVKAFFKRACMCTGCQAGFAASGHESAMAF